MKILFITKYPPIEGGVSSRNYWLAKALGERGHEVYFLTNSLQVEEVYQEKMDLADASVRKKFIPPNVFLYSLKKDPPYHIPYSKLYLSRLVNLGLKIIAERKPDVIFAHYLEPYAAAGFILKKITGLPLAIKHAGSDILRLLPDEDFKYFLAKVISEADLFFSSESLLPMFNNLGATIKKIRYMPDMIDDKIFSPGGEKFNFLKFDMAVPLGVPVITYIGKAAKNKGLAEVIKALGTIEDDFRLLLISAGKELVRYQDQIKTNSNFKNKCIYINFIPPWDIPPILCSSAFVLNLENHFPIFSHSPIKLWEAIACGTPILLSQEIFSKIKFKFLKNANNFMVVENVQDIETLRAKLVWAIKNTEKIKAEAAEIRLEYLEKTNFDAQIREYVKSLQSIMKRGVFSKLRYISLSGTFFL